MKKCISCCLSHQNPATYLFRSVCLFWLINGAWSVQIYLLIQTKTLFRYYGLWTHILDIKNVLFQLLSAPDVNWIFLSALILTAPIHCRASIAETLMQWLISKISSQLIFRKYGIFPVNMSSWQSYVELFLDRVKHVKLWTSPTLPLSLHKLIHQSGSCCDQSVSSLSVPSEGQLRSDQFARHVWAKFGLTNFMKRRADWQEAQTGESKKRKMFSDILQ